MSENSQEIMGKTPVIDERKLLESVKRLETDLRILENEHFELKESLYEKSFYNLFAEISNGALLLTGEIEENDQYFCTPVSSDGMFKIVQGQYHVYSGKIDNEKYCGIAYFNEDFTFIGFECNTPSEYVDYPLTIPENAYYIASCSQEKEPKITLDVQQAKIEIVNNNLFEHKEGNIYAVFTVGALLKTGKPYDDREYRRTSVTNPNMFYVKEDAQHYYTGVIDNTDYFGVGYYDENFNFLSYECGIPGEYENYLLSIPENTTYIGACSKGANPVISFIIENSQIKKLDKSVYKTIEKKLEAGFAAGAILKTGKPIDDELYWRTSVKNLNAMFKVVDNAQHYYTGEIDNEDYCGVGYYDENYKFVSYDCGEPGIYEEYALNVPENATYIGACSMETQPVINVMGKESLVEKLDNAVYQIRHKILDAGFAAGALQKTGKLIGNGRYQRTSVTNSNAMFRAQPNAQHYYTGEIDHEDYCGVGFYNASYRFLGYGCGEIGKYEEYPFDVPDGTAFIGACSLGEVPVVESMGEESRLVEIEEFTSTKTIHVNINSESEDEDGTRLNPYKSISAAIQNNFNRAHVCILIYEGDYRETIPIGLFSYGSVQIIGKEGHRVRIMGSQKLEDWEKVEGWQSIYMIPFNSTIPEFTYLGGCLIFEDGNPSKEIEEQHFHPLQRNLTHRLPFTPIYQRETIEEVETIPGSYCVIDGYMYLHTSNSDNPNENGFGYENIVRSCNSYTKMENQKEAVDLELRNLQFIYSSGGFYTNGFNKVIRNHCSSLCTRGSGAWNNCNGYIETWFEEAGFCDNDGENSHFSGAFTEFDALSDNRSHSPTVIHHYMWSHDNADDGESSHENHNVVLEGCLLEFNGDSGSRPSNDATYYVRDCIFRRNGWEVTENGALTSPSRGGEGLSVVNPVQSPYRVGGRTIAINCLSEENNVGFAAISQDSNRIELINCISRNNNTELYVDEGKMIVRNCKAMNVNPSNIKVIQDGSIEIWNDELIK